MGFTLERATAADVDDLTAIMVAATTTNPVIHGFDGSVSKEAIFEYVRASRVQPRLAGPGVGFGLFETWKVVNEEG